ncbi:MAG: 3'-5' exonuclease [Hydrogenophaga sp.]|uniref:3'-5' exonuclease n=1 Tax=Hydrogenophaga sp. TaxID=1904254 RepID=UPI0027323CD1|nr:3'-5' exonuclease [Hydrogenophaga sp.]MDP3349599.1 3'-5' exonuclease [Hydrogenophaga sp.]
MRGNTSTSRCGASQLRRRPKRFRHRKGLEFPVVALVGVRRIPAEGEDEREEARLFYVGATRATQRLVIGASGSREVGRRLN